MFKRMAFAWDRFWLISFRQSLNALIIASDLDLINNDGVIKFYKLYVDDTLVLIKHSDISSVLLNLIVLSVSTVILI